MSATLQKLIALLLHAVIIICNHNYHKVFTIRIRNGSKKVFSI